MKISQWIEKNPFIFKKIKERAWGTYELAVSLDGGQTWIGFERPFGWGFSEKEAFEVNLIDVCKNVNLHPSAKQWLGEHRFKECMLAVSASLLHQ